jgi:hypothetical protein
MGKIYRRSGVTPETTHSAFGFILHAFGPAPNERPLWAKLTRQKWTHMALQVGDYVWSQPFRGRGALYEARPYLAQMLSMPRYWSNIHIETDELPFDRLMITARKIHDLKAQPIRTVLRYLRIWPWPAWNCIGPARLMLAEAGIQTKEETPDGLIEEIFSAIETARQVGACEQDTTT